MLDSRGQRAPGSEFIEFEFGLEFNPDIQPPLPPVPRGLWRTLCAALPALLLLPQQRPAVVPVVPPPPSRARIAGVRAAAKAAALFFASIPAHAGSTPPVSLFLKVTQKRQSAFSGLAVSAAVRRFLTLPQYQPKSEALTGAPSHFMSTLRPMMSFSCPSRCSRA